MMNVNLQKQDDCSLLVLIYRYYYSWNLLQPFENTNVVKFQNALFNLSGCDLVVEMGHCNVNNPGSSPSGDRARDYMLAKLKKNKSFYCNNIAGRDSDMP